MSNILSNGNYFRDNYNNHYKGKPGSNGLTGFKPLECYMLLKYGNKNNFNIAGDMQYLIELPIYPEQVTEAISVQWSKQSILGRSSPISAYANTDLKSVNFELDLHRDFLTGSYSLDTNALLGIKNAYISQQSAGNQRQSSSGPFDTRSWYININKMLQMSCYPQYTSSGLIPPTTYFVFGQMILKGYVTSYSTTWKKPIINSFYGWNSVQIAMECYPDSIISASEMISGEGAESTQNTYNTPFPTKAAENSNVMSRKFSERHNLRTGNSVGGSPIST